MSMTIRRWSRKSKFEMYNHIFLMIDYTNQLKDLALAQRLIDIGRQAHPNDQELQQGLDRSQTDILAKHTQIVDEMFEISRNN